MKLVTFEALSHFLVKLKELFVAKEKKTGSDTEYRVLSDNNLTDALVEKINAAGAATDVTAEIATAKNEAISSANAYTDAEVSTAKAAAIADAKKYTDTEVGTAKTEAVADAKGYTDTGVASAKTYAETQAGTAKTEAISSANAYTDQAKTTLETMISTGISTAYKVKGSATLASLPALSKTEVGSVYNMSEGFTTTADFVEGASKKYPAGTNVVCIEAREGEFKWDVLAGFIDTDSFVKNSDIENVTTQEIDAMFAA